MTKECTDRQKSRVVRCYVAYGAACWICAIFGFGQHRMQRTPTLSIRSCSASYPDEKHQYMPGKSDARSFRSTTVLDFWHDHTEIKWAANVPTDSSTRNPPYARPSLRLPSMISIVWKVLKFLLIMLNIAGQYTS